MTRLFAAAGVDYIQWRALMKAHTLTDFAALRGADGSAAQLRAVGRSLLGAALFALLGLGMSATIWLAKDLFFAAAVTVASLMWLTGMLALSMATTIVGPDDYAIVAPRPISERTYMVVRVSAVLMQTLEIVLFAGWLPVMAFGTRAQGSWRLALAAAIAIVAASLTTTLSLIAGYQWLLRHVRPAKVARTIVYAQTLGFFLMSIGFMALTMRFAVDGRATLASDLAFTVPRTASLLVFPPAWFAAFVELASGRAGAFQIGGAILAVVALAASAFALGSWTSSPGATPFPEIASGERANGAGRDLAALRGERRAVVMLMVGQLRGDLGVQLGVLTNLLTGVVLMFAWTAFNERGGAPAGIAVLMIPVSIRDVFLRTREHEAVWPFLTSPANQSQLVMAFRDTVAVVALVPAIALFCGFRIYATGLQWHLISEIAALAVSGYVMLQLATVANPALPLSESVARVQSRMFLSIPAMIAGGLIAFPMTAGFRQGRVGEAITLAVAVLLIAGLNRLTRWRVTRKYAATATPA